MDAGVLGRPGTQTLYGGNSIFNGTNGGFRVRGGLYADDCGMSGIDTEFLVLGTRRAGFHDDSTGDPILARPFFNVATGLNDSQLVAFPGLITGAIDVDAKTRLYSSAIHYRQILCKDCDLGDGCGDGCGDCGNCWDCRPRSYTMGFQIGPRYINLKDSIGFTEQLTSVDNGDQFQIYDSFRSKNQFWGCELGLFGSRQHGNWSLDGGARLAIGSTKQQLDVYGQTIVNQAGVTTISSGGLLAQRTNSGSWERNRFALIPQFDVALGYQLSNTWKFSVGYSLLYWGNVVRGPNQIDPVVNPGLLPPEQMPLTGDLRPEARFNQTSFLAQGITLGLEKSW